MLNKKDQKIYPISKKIFKNKPDEMALIRDASAEDILNDLGEISKEEVEYYENIKTK
jgi:hypothetical protein